MIRRALGRTGLDVSVLGFGGSEIGFEGTEAATVRRLLDDALAAGLNVVDTAECYGDSESLIGAALAGRRHDVHLFTKCGHYEGSGQRRLAARPRSSAASPAASSACVPTTSISCSCTRARRTICAGAR